MRRARISEAVDYLPPAVAFGAAVIAVIGSPGWNPEGTGWARITAAGWCVLAISALALTASFFITARDTRQRKEALAREFRIAAIAERQLLSALRHMVHPLVGDSLWKNSESAPTSPFDMLVEERQLVLQSLNLTSVSPYVDGSFNDLRWHEIIERAAREGTELLTKTLQIYAGYLNAQVIESVAMLLDSSFLQRHLLYMHDLVLANTHGDPDRAVSFFFAGRDRVHSDDYAEFWVFHARAMKECGAKMSEKGAPLFLL